MSNLTRAFAKRMKQAHSSAEQIKKDYQELRPVLQDSLSKFETLIRAMDEVTGLAKEIKSQQEAVTGHMVESEISLVDQKNELANLATMASGLEYMLADPHILKSAIEKTPESVLSYVLSSLNGERRLLILKKLEEYGRGLEE